MPRTKKNKQKKSSDSAVQGTNDSSVVSKCSAAAQGYFNDPFLQHFVAKVARRAPLINRGYYVRWRAVDHCVRTFLQVTAKCPSRQILSLGAGFDSLYFRLRADGALNDAVVFEVDFPDVARRKAALIASNISLRGMLDSPLLCLTVQLSLVPVHSKRHLRALQKIHSLILSRTTGRNDSLLMGRNLHLQNQAQDGQPSASVSGGPVYVSSSRHVLLGLDLRDEVQLEDVLGAAGLDWTTPTLILSEVVLTYMETQWSDAVISWAAQRLPQSLFVMYEQIRPHDPFGRIMQEHFLKLNSTLHALLQYPDTSTQRRRFLDKGWDCCVCLDMNDFYSELVHEQERRRVESLEPFDEHEEWHAKCSHYFILTASRGSLMQEALLPVTVSQVPSVGPSRSPAALDVRTVPVCLEGVGMASAWTGPGQVLLTGGSGRGGRMAESRALLRGLEGWRSVAVEPSEHLGVRLHHTLTRLPAGGTVIHGGRASPLRPLEGLVKLTFEPGVLPAAAEPTSGDALKVCVEPMICTGSPPSPRWRHTSAVVQHRGGDFLFVFGGKNQSDSALGDALFLCLERQDWIEIPVDGTAPAARHSHSACSYRGGALVFGGLSRRGTPLGDTALLRPTETGFGWETVDVRPPPVARYSHCAHVVGDKLLVVGGVWWSSEGVPGVVVIDLNTCSSREFSLDTSSVPWPLMLHSFCSELTDPSEPKLLLIGGGGNCFSFGTHLNPQLVSVDLRPVLD